MDVLTKSAAAPSPGYRSSEPTNLRTLRIRLAISLPLYDREVQSLAGARRALPLYGRVVIAEIEPRSRAGIVAISEHVTDAKSLSNTDSNQK